MAHLNGRVLRLRHGRYNTNEFLLTAPPGLDLDVAWERLQNFEPRVRFFALMGTVAMLPTGRFANPNQQGATIMTDVMFFKTFKGNLFRVNCDNIDLLFFRVPGVPDRPLICAPNRGRTDWRYGVLNKITQNGYRAISRHGNYFNVKAWLAEKTKPQMTNMIVALRDGTCRSYEDAMKRWPVSAFRHFRGVQNLLQETKHKARRVEEVIGTQPFRLLTEN